jgi:hypothetical protein
MHSILDPETESHLARASCACGQEKGIIGTRIEVNELRTKAEDGFVQYVVEFD